MSETTNRYSEQINQLKNEKNLSDADFLSLIECPDELPELTAAADAVRRKVYGDAVFLRGLIEFTNVCKNNCYYCGIRCGNDKVERYRLSKEDILSCCDTGYALGYRTFVLQGGEDPYFKAKRLCDILDGIRSKYPDCMITLSVGERSREDYKAFFDAGAGRYLLRHETATDAHYAKLHPESMSLSARKSCLFALKEIGYQVGAGFMVGSPYQTTENLVADIRFLQELDPDMIGIGPFLHHADTPFAAFPDGSLFTALRLLSILRLCFPHALLPATTALGTIHPAGRELGLKAGANVVMPNLSPVKTRKLYALYDNKICMGDEAAECRACLEKRVTSAGYRIVTDVGNVRRTNE